MLPHMVAFLLMGKIPPTCEGIRIIHSWEVIRHCQCITQCCSNSTPSKEVLYLLYLNIIYKTCCGFSKDNMTSKKKSNQLSFKWGKNFLQQNEHHPIRIFRMSTRRVFFLCLFGFFFYLFSVRKGKISVSALHILSEADANETSY